MLGDSAQASLAKSGFYVFILKVVSVLMTVATTIILARVLEPEQYGLYTLVLTVVCLLVLPSRAGISTLTVREIARQLATKSWGAMKGYLRWSTAVVSLLSLLVMLASASMLWLWRDSLSSLELSSAAWGLLLIPVMALNALRSAAMRGLSQAVRGILLEATLRPGLFLLAVLLIIFSGSLTSDKAIGLQFFAALTAVALGTWWLHKLKPNQLARAKPCYDAHGWNKAIIPLALLSGAQQVIKYTDIIALGYFRSSADVGIYRVAVQCSELVLFVLVTLTLVLAPKIAGLYASNDHDTLKKLIRFSSRLLLVSALPLTLILVFGGKYIIGFVFGTVYTEGYNALIILSIGQLGVAIMGIAPMVLRMTNHEQASLAIMAGAAISNLILNIILIQLYGINGAAMATAITLISAHLAMVFYVSNRLGINTMPFLSYKR